MISLSPTLQSLVDATQKSAIWLFTVTDKNGTVYRWSTKSFDDGAIEYEFKITNFSGVTLSRPKSETGIVAPANISFNVINAANAMSAANFVGGTVLVQLALQQKGQVAWEAGVAWDSGVAWDDSQIPHSVIRAWKFAIISVDPGYQVLAFECEDFLQQYIRGDYPNGQLPKAIWASNDTDLDDKLCVPVPIGTAYLPLRSVYITDQRYYLLGPTTVGGAAVTYTLTKVRSPRSWGVKTEWESASYTFQQSTEVGGDGESYRVFKALIAPVGGPYTANGLWRDGEHFLDVPTKFTRSDTASLTNPADAIAFILADMGIAAADIDTDDSFADAKDVYDTLGIEWNGGYYRKQPRDSVIAGLLAQCHSTLRIGEKLELYPLSKTSQKTITKAEVLKQANIGPGSFRYRSIVERVADCAYVSWQQSDEAQDLFLKALVPVTGIKKTTIEDETINIHLVQDSQDVQRLGILYYQRKLGKIATISAALKSTCLILDPDDVITISHDDYGGTFDVLIDSIKITKDLMVEIECTRFGHALDDWTDLVNNQLAWESGVVWESGVAWDNSLTPLLSVAVDDTSYVMP